MACKLEMLCFADSLFWAKHLRRRRRRPPLTQPLVTGQKVGVPHLEGQAEKTRGTTSFTPLLEGRCCSARDRHHLSPPLPAPRQVSKGPEEEKRDRRIRAPHTAWGGMQNKREHNGKQLEKNRHCPLHKFHRDSGKEKSKESPAQITHTPRGLEHCTCSGTTRKSACQLLIPG